MGQIQTCVPHMLCRRRPCLTGAGHFFLPESFLAHKTERVCTSASIKSMLFEHLCCDFSRWDFSPYSLPLLQANFTPSHTRGLLQSTLLSALTRDVGAV